MLIMHFVNENTNAEYVVFSDEPHEDFDHDAAEEENARPGFTLKGAWEANPEPLAPTYGEFLPGEGDVYMMQR